MVEVFGGRLAGHVSGDCGWLGEGLTDRYLSVNADVCGLVPWI